MAAYYWDYGSTGSTWSSTGTAGNSTRFLYWASGGSAPQCQWVYSYTVEKYVVVCPEHWTMDAEVAAFVRLLNDETRTGFTVGLVIDGDVRITDPSIHKRTMDEFRQLLMRAASAEDRPKIATFFETYPCVPKPTAA